MFNRCIHCGDKCPDFSDVCDSCAYIDELDQDWLEFPVDENDVD